VNVSGTFTDGGLWLQLWWNADGDAPAKVDSPPWPPTGPDLRFAPVGPGPVVKLASMPGPESGNCSFQTSFTVPDVGPGTYQLVWVFGVINPPQANDSFALLVSGPTPFEVTG
jgi:hypothetical protein